MLTYFNQAIKPKADALDVLLAQAENLDNQLKAQAKRIKRQKQLLDRLGM